MANQEEEVLGKAYDARLMRRLLTYLRPYTWQVTVALIAIILKAILDVLGPFLTKTAIDKYLAHAPGSHSILDSWLSSQPMKGIAQIALLYVGTLVLTFFCEFLQTYYMQWTGQMVMFDLRSQIFRHLQRMHIGFYDKNPVGRLVTRVTTDVDALNEMFTAGGVSLFQLLPRCGPGYQLAVDMGLAHPSRDELAELGSEVEHEDCLLPCSAAGFFPRRADRGGLADAQAFPMPTCCACWKTLPSETIAGATTISTC